MAILLNHAPFSQPDGTRVFGPVNVPNALQEIRVSIDRCTTATPTLWPSPDTWLDFFIEVSLDGGATWLRTVGATAPGGIVMGKGGVEAPATFIGCSLPEGTGRRARATATVTGGPLDSRITVEAI